MLFVLYGENEVEMNKFISSIIKDENIDTKVVYDYDECNIEDVIEEALYFDLFGNKKIIILNNADFLTSKRTLENKMFDKYIENPNETTILILKVMIEKLDERKKIVKTLKEKGIFKEFKIPKENDLDNYIKNYFKEKEYKISEEATKEISKRISTNINVINKELEKLEILKFESKEITISDVEKLITKYEQNNIFKLVDAVIKKDTKEIFSLYKTLIDEKEEPTVILVLLANQFRLLYQVKVLSEEGWDKYKISNFLKEHHYRISLALEKSRFITYEDLLKMLKKLYNIDIKIKTGEIDKVSSLELFFLEL